MYPQPSSLELQQSSLELQLLFGLCQAMVNSSEIYSRTKTKKMESL